MTPAPRPDPLGGIRRRLGLDRVTAGERRSWTVRLEHGVHIVRLDETPLGNRVVLDGREVARSAPWTYDASLRFAIADREAEVRSEADTSRGTLRTELLVGGERIAPDARYPGRTRRIDARAIAERAAYAFGGALVVAGVVGPPISTVVHDLVWIGGYVLLTAGLVAIDPFLFFPVLIDKAIEDRPSMIVAGSAIAALAAVARDRFGLKARIPLVRERALLPRLLGWIALAVTAVAVVSVS